MDSRDLSKFLNFWFWNALFRSQFKIFELVFHFVVFLFQRVPAKCFTSDLIACQEVTCMMTLAVGTTVS